MKENLYYLFTAGLILGSGPCLSFCAPVLISYTIAQKGSFKKSIVSYAVFSLFKLLAYGLLGLVCAGITNLLSGAALTSYSRIIYIGLGIFIVVIGVATLLPGSRRFGSFCALMNTGHARNVGVLGFLVGFSPCLPLLGILNYVILISQNPFQAVLLTLVFGLGTVFSPIILLIMFSAKFADIFSKSEKIKLIFQIICGIVLIAFGAKVVFQQY